MKSIIGLSTNVTPTKSEHADINIFTVASGLLYERFASIMILSVMKHTNSSVKFCFIVSGFTPIGPNQITDHPIGEFPLPNLYCEPFLSFYQSKNTNKCPGVHS